MRLLVFQEGRTLTQNESKESKHNWKGEREEIPEPGPPSRPPIPQRLIGELKHKCMVKSILKIVVWDIGFGH
jgi:hypothetical protein